MLTTEVVKLAHPTDSHIFCSFFRNFSWWFRISVLLSSSSYRFFLLFVLIIFLWIHWWHFEWVFRWVHILRFFWSKLVNSGLLDRWAQWPILVVACLIAIFTRWEPFSESSIAVSWAIIGWGCVILRAIRVKILIVERDDVWGAERLLSLTTGLPSLHSHRLLTHLFFEMLPSQSLEVTHTIKLLFISVHLRRRVDAWVVHWVRFNHSHTRECLL